MDSSSFYESLSLQACKGQMQSHFNKYVLDCSIKPGDVATISTCRYNGDNSESTSTGYTAEAMMRVFPDEKVMLAPSVLLLNGEGRPSLRLGVQTQWQF